MEAVSRLVVVGSGEADEAGRGCLGEARMGWARLIGHVSARSFRVRPGVSRQAKAGFGMAQLMGPDTEVVAGPGNARSAMADEVGRGLFGCGKARTGMADRAG